MLKTQLSKVFKVADLKPLRGDRNLAVGEANAKGMNVTHGKTIKYTWNRVAVAGIFAQMAKTLYDFRELRLFSH